MTAPGPSPARLPSPALPLAYFAAGVTAFVGAALAVPALGAELAGHYYQPRLLALTHLVALGWITLTILGASYQLVPVVVERPLWSERLAGWQLACLVLGVVGMVAHFWTGRWAGLAWAGGLVGIGVLSHAVNIALSLRRLSRWSFTARGFALGLAGLTLTVGAGMTLAVTHGRAALPGGVLAAVHAHFHLALLGWIAPMIVGVGARVYPMFLLAPELGGPGARRQAWGLGLGAPAVALGLVTAWPGVLLLGAVAVVVALATHVAWVARAFRQSRRPSLDWGLRFVLTGTACLVPGIALGLAGAAGLAGGPRMALAYGVLALGGWVSLTIAGVMLKIVPFLVWYRVWAPRVGREPVPTLAQLTWPAAERLAYAGLTAGVLGLTGAVWSGRPVAIEWAGGILAAGGLAFVAALGRPLLQLLPGGASGTRTSPVAAQP